MTRGERKTRHGKPRKNTRKCPGTTRQRNENGAVPPTVDSTGKAGLSVTVNVEYLNGAAGERLAAAQASAISALLHWTANTRRTEEKES